MMNERHSIIPYVGGKYDQSPWIVSKFPRGYTSYGYLEPFCGGLSVFFMKQPSDVEVLTDADGDLVNLWMVIQRQGDELARAALRLPYARKIYDTWAADWYRGIRPLDDFERALRFYYLARTSFSGKNQKKSGWARSIKKNQARAYYNITEREIVWAMERLQGVQIECGSYKQAIKQYSDSSCLIYCDPPFIGTEHYYKHTFGAEDHIELAGILNDCPGYVVLSYHDHPMLHELYPQGKWFWNWRNASIDCNGTTGADRDGSKKKQVVDEVVITNYREQLSLF